MSSSNSTALPQRLADIKAQLLCRRLGFRGKPCLTGDSYLNFDSDAWGCAENEGELFAWELASGLTLAACADAARDPLTDLSAVQQLVTRWEAIRALENPTVEARFIETLSLIECLALDAFSSVEHISLDHVRGELRKRCQPRPAATAHPQTPADE